VCHHEVLYMLLLLLLLLLLARSHCAHCPTGLKARSVHLARYMLCHRAVLRRHCSIATRDISNTAVVKHKQQSVTICSANRHINNSVSAQIVWMSRFIVFEGDSELLQQPDRERA
jgi:hypothetical protein